MDSFLTRIFGKPNRSLRKFDVLIYANCLSQEELETGIYKFRFAIYSPFIAAIFTPFKFIKLKNRGHFNFGLDPISNDVCGALVCMIGTLSIAFVTSAYFFHKLFEFSNPLYKKYRSLGALSKELTDFVESSPN
ncbi:hypothetical protein SteCoe_22341 [Stentor coeruleus]|uniref:Uncharacterized protein n=1 Tax=Stentor coeruleus TaxID=5963 RepID=A0A1R2BMD0_9CILI|nr:hypothetical protein SteCoe_22341 [Stentor coeruleus]